MSRLIIPVFVTLLIISGCTSSYSPGKSALGEAVYLLDAKQADKIAYSAITEVFPDYSPRFIDGAEKAYALNFVAWNGMDTYLQKIVYAKVRGTSSKGKTIKGFRFQVSGGGSSFVHGAAKNKELFDRLSQKLAGYKISYVESFQTLEIKTASQRDKSVWQDIKTAAINCRLKRTKGEIPDYKSEVACAISGAEKILESTNYAHMDLVELLFAHRSLNAKKVDRGDINGEEFHVQELEVTAKINTAILQREAANKQIKAAERSKRGSPSGNPQPSGAFANSLIGGMNEAQINYRLQQMQWDIDRNSSTNAPGYYNPGVPDLGYFSRPWGQ
jgi:hypothetical protein